MIETLFELVKASGIERMNISLQPSDGERVSVCIQCILGSVPDHVTDEQRELRKALAKPIGIEGFVGEVDAKLEEFILGYVRTATPLVNKLVTNVEQVKSELNKADSTMSKAKSLAIDSPINSDTLEGNEDEFQEIDFEADSATSL